MRIITASERQLRRLWTRTFQNCQVVQLRGLGQCGGATRPEDAAEFQNYGDPFADRTCVRPLLRLWLSETAPSVDPCSEFLLVLDISAPRVFS